MSNFLLIIFLSLAGYAGTPDGSGLQISGVADILGTQNIRGNPLFEDRNDVREGEIMLYSPIDHLFDGTISAAAHNENGEHNFEVHEAFIASSRLIPNSHLRFGQFFLGVGRLNQVHRHEWPFVSAPKVHSEFFGEEAAMDTGMEYGYLLPTSFYLDVTAGLTSGWNYGHSHTAGSKPLVPTHYLRAQTFFGITDGSDGQLGLNYLSRTDSANSKMTLMGLDFISKAKENRRLVFLFQTEIWVQEVRSATSPVETKVGAYLFPQYGFNDQWSLGVRGDYFTVTTLENVAGEKIPNLDYGFVPTLSFKPSEFSTFRLAFTQSFNMNNNQTTNTSAGIELQATFVIGSHPAHSF